jgi:cell division protein FtsB
MLFKQIYQKYFPKVRSIIMQFSDIRIAGQAVFVVIVLLVSWSGVRAIDTNYILQKQIATLQQQNQLHGLENTNLQLSNEYYSSDQYLELSARQNFGLGKPGETELIVPQSVALSYVVAPSTTSSVVVGTRQLPAFERNFQAWIDFFLHRQPPAN